MGSIFASVIRILADHNIVWLKVELGLAAAHGFSRSKRIREAKLPSARLAFDPGHTAGWAFSASDCETTDQWALKA
jgi:hypothetical protein